MQKDELYKLIDLARERHNAILDGINSPNYKTSELALMNFLDQFDYNDILKIEAMMLFGRSDFESFDEALSHLQNTYPLTDRSKEEATWYIISKTPLYVYLQNALSFTHFDDVI